MIVRTKFTHTGAEYLNLSMITKAIWHEEEASIELIFGDLAGSAYSIILTDDEAMKVKKTLELMAASPIHPPTV